MKRVPRVIHLLSGDRWAGAEVATYHLVLALAARGDTVVEVILLNPGELARRLQDGGVEVTVVPEAGRSFRSLLRSVRASVAAADLVHAHRYKENLLAALSRRPWVSTQHGRPERFRGLAALRMGLYQGIDRAIKRWSARRVIGVSEEVEAWLVDRIGRRRVVRCWNGIADPQPEIQAPPWSQRPRRVGVLGRLAPVKRFSLAVESVAACPDLELEIVGEGSEREPLERLVDRLGLRDRVRFLGQLAHPLGHVARWRALLVPSLHEGNPVSVLESLALGTPVLAGRLPGVLEILSGAGGWLVSGEDGSARWAEALRRIIDDAPGGEAASRAARQRYLDAFTARAAAERMRGVYAQVLRGERV